MINTKTLLELIAKNIPDDPNEFNSETGFGEPQHWLDLPKDRSLEIVYEETGDNNRYYSWRVHCSEKEFDKETFHDTMGVIATETADDLTLETRIRLITWAIEIASMSIKQIKKVMEE